MKSLSTQPGYNVAFYKTKEQLISINTNTYQIRTLKDRQQFSDQGHHAEKLGINDASWSLFGVVWPASRVLASTVENLGLNSEKVLEIGCGIALSSIVLHHSGVDITASDYHPLTEEFLQVNAQSNDLSPVKYLTGNWNVENPDLGEFDMIIGSDILYEPDHAELISNFIDKHAKNTARIIIIDPDRSNHRKFTLCMITLGFTHYYERFSVEGDKTVKCKGRILYYERKVN